MIKVVEFNNMPGFGGLLVFESHTDNGELEWRELVSISLTNLNPGKVLSSMEVREAEDVELTIDQMNMIEPIRDNFFGILNILRITNTGEMILQ